MKFLSVLFLVGLALASAIPVPSSDAVSYSELQDLFNDLAYSADDKEEPKTELGKKLKEHFDELLEKLRDAVDQGKGVKEDVLVKLKEVHEKLKDLKVDIGDKAKELLEKLKDKVKDYWKKILDKLNPDNKSFYSDDEDEEEKIRENIKEKLIQILERIKDVIENGKSVGLDIISKIKELRDQMKEKSIPLGEKAKEIINRLREKANGFWKSILDLIAGNNDDSKRSIDEFDLLDAESVSEADFNIFEILKKLKKVIQDKFDADELKEKVETLFGKGNEFTEQLFKMLNEKGEKGKNKILEWIDRVLGEKEQRSISDIYDKVKNFFKDLNIDLKEKFTKFGEWVKNQYEKGLEKGKSKLENVKKIAKEFLEDTKKISKDVAGEALDFFKEYKEDLKGVYDDIKVKVKEILKGN